MWDRVGMVLGNPSGLFIYILHVNSTDFGPNQLEGLQFCLNP